MNLRLFLLLVFFVPILLSAGAIQKPVLGKIYTIQGFQYDSFYYTYKGEKIFLKQLYDQAAVPAGLSDLSYSNLREVGMKNINTNPTFLMETMNLININNLASNRANWIQFRDAMAQKNIPVWPVVTNHSEYPLILNGEILIEFFKWTDKSVISEVLKKYNLELIEEKMMNPFFIKAKLPIGSDPFEIANSIYETGLVNWAQPNWYRVLVPYGEPNDTYYKSGKQDWYLDMMNVPTAWSINEGSSSIKVGVIDSGVWYDHEDLAANIDPIEPVNGYYYDYLGKVTVSWGTPRGGTPDNDPRPELIDTGDTYNDHAGMAHGTACSGIIAAVGNNGKGVSGICQKCKIIPIRLIGALPQMSQEDAQYDAIMLAVTKGAGVINNSYGRATKNPTTGQCMNNGDNTAVTAVRDAKKNGRGGKGTLTVWAAGNDTCPTSTTPQFGDDNFIVVSAIDTNGAVASYSNYGVEVDVSAPAASFTTDIPGTDGMTKLGSDWGIDNSYTQSFNGTSAAAPATSGAIALMLSENPNMDFQAAVSCLKNAAKKVNKSCSYDSSKWVSQNDPYVAGGSKLHSYCYGFGLVDAAAMVAGAKDGSCSSACVPSAKVDLCYGAGYEKDDDCDNQTDESCDKGGEGRTASACTADDECGNTAASPYCKKDWPGGYCTAKCTTNTDCYNKNSNKCVNGECLAICTYNEIREGYGCISGVIQPSNSPNPVCGNSTVESGEVCDKNTKSCTQISSSYISGTASCKSDCSGWDTSKCQKESDESVCGDGKTEGEEVCDGNKVACNTLIESKPVGEASCKSDCSGWDTSSCKEQSGESVCGNKIVELGEECDDGNQNNDDECDNSCKKTADKPDAVCGNGIKEGDEECDDGNGLNDDGCDTSCRKTPVCGNGIKEGNEECDDGNTNSFDSCTTFCKINKKASDEADSEEDDNANGTKSEESGCSCSVI